MERCPWCEGFELYREYHDNEWAVPLFDDSALFELLILEGAQAGLSWATVLKKRAHYRQVFDGFKPELRSCPRTWCKSRSGSHGLRHGWHASQTVTADRLMVGLSPTSAKVSSVM